jgi:hypothetical protein
VRCVVLLAAPCVRCWAGRGVGVRAGLHAHAALPLQHTSTHGALFAMLSNPQAVCVQHPPTDQSTRMHTPTHPQTQKPHTHTHARMNTQTWTVDQELKGWPAAQRNFFDAGQVRARRGTRCVSACGAVCVLPCV